MCFEGVRVIEGRMRALKRPHTDWQKGRVPYQGLLFSLMKTKSGVKLFFNIKKKKRPDGRAIPTSLHLEKASDISCTF